jgi:DNA-nicking Smr family endonuclease
MKIDLHGVKHQDVQRKLDVFFWECMQKKINQVEVITGISPRMKEIVKEICKDYGFDVIEFSFNPGSLTVDL